MRHKFLLLSVLFLLVSSSIFSEIGYKVGFTKFPNISTTESEDTDEGTETFLVTREQSAITNGLRIPIGESLLDLNLGVRSKRETNGHLLLWNATWFLKTKLGLLGPAYTWDSDSSEFSLQYAFEVNVDKDWRLGIQTQLLTQREGETNTLDTVGAYLSWGLVDFYKVKPKQKEMPVIWETVQVEKVNSIQDAPKKDVIGVDYFVDLAQYDNLQEVLALVQSDIFSKSMYFDPKSIINKEVLAGYWVRFFSLGSNQTSIVISDLPSNNNREAIQTVVSNDIFSVDSSGAFKPKDWVTNEIAIVTFLRSAGIVPNPHPGLAAYSDVPKTHWAFPYIQEARFRGLWPSQETFGLKQLIKKEQILNLMIAYRNMPKEVHADVSNPKWFKDVSDSDRKILEYLAEEGAIERVEMYYPNQEMTKADLAYSTVEFFSIPYEEAPRPILDLPLDGLIADSIQTIVQTNVMSLDGKGQFFPNQKVTKAIGITVFVRSAGWDISKSKIAMPYQDLDVRHWVYPYVAAAYKHSVLLDSSELNLEVPLTKMDFATWEYRFLKAQAVR